MHPLDELDDMRDKLEAGKLRYMIYSGVLGVGIPFFFVFKFAVHYFKVLPWDQDIIQVFIASLFLGLVSGHFRWSSLRMNYEALMVMKPFEFPDDD